MNKGLSVQKACETVQGNTISDALKKLLTAFCCLFLPLFSSSCPVVCMRATLTTELESTGDLCNRNCEKGFGLAINFHRFRVGEDGGGSQIVI